MVSASAAGTGAAGFALSSAQATQSATRACTRETRCKSAISVHLSLWVCLLVWVAMAVAVSVVLAAEVQMPVLGCCHWQLAALLGLSLLLQGCSSGLWCCWQPVTLAAAKPAVLIRLTKAVKQGQALRQVQETAQPLALLQSGLAVQLAGCALVALQGSTVVGNPAKLSC